MPRRNQPRPDRQRSAIADEAARLIQDHGLSNFRSAKQKAGQRLRLENRGALPSNQEVEQAIAERNRIFHAEDHDQHIDALRQAALVVMRQLPEFDPRLAGPVLSGSASDHDDISLHLFSDSPEAVGSALETLGYSSRAIQHRLRMRRDESDLYPGYRFRSGEFEFCAIVFEERGRGNAPLSAVDGKPMRRATPRDVENLLSARGGRNGPAA